MQGATWGRHAGQLSLAFPLTQVWGQHVRAGAAASVAVPDAFGGFSVNNRKDSWGEMLVFLMVKWCRFSAVSIWNQYCCVSRQMTAQYNAFLIMWLKWDKWVFYQMLKFLCQWVNVHAKNSFLLGKNKKQNKKIAAVGIVLINSLGVSSVFSLKVLILDHWK